MSDEMTSDCLLVVDLRTEFSGSINFLYETLCWTRRLGPLWTSEEEVFGNLRDWSVNRK
jgi:hypothetical protein